MPTAPESLIQFFQRESKGQEFSEELRDHIVIEIEEAFIPLRDPEIVKDVIVEYVQKKTFRQVLKEARDRVDETDDDIYDDFMYRIQGIRDLGKEDDSMTQLGGFLLRDFKRGDLNLEVGVPCQFQAINEKTSKNGFASPELIILMGAPKSFKTGTLLNFMLGFVRDGLNVYYVDCENGKDSIMRRMKQAMVEATYMELREDTYGDELENIVKMTSKRGGDFVADFYPAHTKSVSDVKKNLAWYRDEHGWKPDVIAWDYPDLMKSSDKYIKEKRLNIQAVYHEIIALNYELGVFSFGLSQVSRQAVDKEVLSIKDFAEDFGKAANCHGAFALCRTPEEVKHGLMRIVPIAQREGEAQGKSNQAVFEVDESRQVIRERDMLAMANIKKRKRS